MDKQEEYLLIPIKVDALVIEGAVDPDSDVLLKALPEISGNMAGDLKWSPGRADYNRVVGDLYPPGPELFFGAKPKAGGENFSFKPLLLDETDSSGGNAMPKSSDRGVYLHWTLPPALRRSSKPNTLEFPPLPDQWLVVRFARGTNAPEETPRVRAWFIDGSAEVDEDSSSASLLTVASEEADQRNAYIGQRLGRVSRLEDVTEYTAPFEKRHTITALGNEYTGSLTFTAFIAENRNVLSWHDALTDLRDEEHKVPTDTALSYLVVGWHRDPKQDPLAALSGKELSPADFKVELERILSSLDWKCTDVPENLTVQRCLYHAMVAQIHYWNPHVYKGPLLGYPGAPPVNFGGYSGTQSVALAIGNTVEDAFVALAGNAFRNTGDKQLWKALEAVIYRQVESLIEEDWPDERRERQVHRNGFASQDAGTVWSIVSSEQDASLLAGSGAAKAPPLPGVASSTAALTGRVPLEPPRLTTGQIEALRTLNQTQAEIDSHARDAAALQHELYAIWWRERKNETLGSRSESAAVQACLDDLSGLRVLLTSLEQEFKVKKALLESQLAGTAMELRADAAPGFWSPADPVIVMQNVGKATRRTFPDELPCRFSSAVVTRGKVQVGRGQTALQAEFVAGEVITPLKGALAVFGRLASGFIQLMQEAAVVEHSVARLIAWTLPKLKADGSRGEMNETDWDNWNKLLSRSLQADQGQSEAVIFFLATDAQVPAERIFALWSRQPWAPLFLDWRISWHPAASVDEGFSFTGRDYHPREDRGMKSVERVASGRSLLAPISGQLFSEPLEELSKRLDGQVMGGAGSGELKKGKEPKFPREWRSTLRELREIDLVGQVLTGLHQLFLGRDINLPRVRPDSVHPWSQGSRPPEAEVQRALSPLAVQEGRPPIVLPEHAPPGREPRSLIPGVPEDIGFSLYRAGWFRLEQLWIVDEFGQWADLLGGSSYSKPMTPLVHPRLRCPGGSERIAMPPRLIQPTRFEFDFVPAVSSREDPTNPVCGWVYHHALDQALAVCDQNGALLGELAVTQDIRGARSVSWESLARARNVEPAQIPDPDLRSFVLGLLEEQVTEKTGLESLLELIRAALKRRTGATSSRDAGLLEQPLALAKAQAGLSLFGQRWQDWRMPSGKQVVQGDGSSIKAFTVPVLLGDPDVGQDGLIGYYRREEANAPSAAPPVLDRIVPAPDLNVSGKYIADPWKDAAVIGFDSRVSLILLLDPRGSVLGSIGLLPAKPLTLAPSHVEAGTAHIEGSFRVGPVLTHPGAGAIPVPAGTSSEWFFQGPASTDEPLPLAPFDPSPKFDPTPRTATEGRLIRRQPTSDVDSPIKR